MAMKNKITKVLAAILITSAHAAHAQDSLPSPVAPSASETGKPPENAGGSSNQSLPAAAPQSVVTPQPTPTDTQTTRKVTVVRPKSKIEEYGTSLIFSADLGLLSVFPSKKLQNFGPKYGLAVEAKALGSVLLNRVVLDAGFGWSFFNISGIEPMRNDEGSTVYLDPNDSSTVQTVEETLRLSNAMLEIAPSFRISNVLFSGPVMQFRYPADLGYDSRKPDKKLGVSIGAQGGYQIFDRDLNTRFVGRMMFTLNDTNWLGLYAMAGVQVGLPFTQPEILTIKETTTQTREKRVVEYRKREFKVKVTRDLVKMLMDNMIIFYDDPETPILTTETQSFLVDLVQALTDEGLNWGLLRIDTISRQHARVIRDALVAAGLPTQKIRFGTVIQAPRTTNPPVEFGFQNVKEPERLTETLRVAMKELQIPETCEGGQCQ